MILSTTLMVSTGWCRGYIKEADGAGDIALPKSQAATSRVILSVSARNRVEK
jgi:hypothetical protein